MSLQLQIFRMIHILLFIGYKVNDFIPKKHYQKNKSLILTFSKSFKGFSEDFMLKFGTHNFLYFLISRLFNGSKEQNQHTFLVSKKILVIFLLQVFLYAYILVYT